MKKVYIGAAIAAALVLYFVVTRRQAIRSAAANTASQTGGGEPSTIEGARADAGASIITSVGNSISGYIDGLSR